MNPLLPLLVSLSLSTALLHAQEAASPARGSMDPSNIPAAFNAPMQLLGQGNTSAASPAQNTKGANDISSMLETGFASLDVNSDEGTMSWKGRTFDIGTSRVFRSRFERYLAQAERTIESHIEYQALLNEVLDLLSPVNQTGGETIFTENVEKAYRLLYKASNYPQDGGSSKVLAHMIYNSWRMREEIRQSIRQLTYEERKEFHQQAIVLNRRFIANAQMRDDVRTMKANEIDAYNSLRGGRDYSDVSIEEDRLAQMRTGLELSGKRLEIQVQLAQFQFQSQIIYFILQRRFEHSLMASYFYRALFKGSAQQVQVGDQILSNFFPQGDMVYTVEALEQISLEAMHDVKSTMEAVEYSLAEDDLHTAMERLQECFYIGEHLQPVAGMPRNERQRIFNYYKLLRKARELIALKDYDKLLEVNSQLQEISNDSRFTEISSYVNNAKQIANLKLAEARFLMTSNKFTDAQEALKQSTATWPLNPHLATLTENIFAQTDAAQSVITKFDHAIKNKEYRAIFNDRHAMGLGLANDPEKAATLAQIVDSVGAVDMILNQAETLRSTGNHNGALELALRAEEILPEDREVLVIKSQLLPMTGEFSKALQIAAQLERHKEYILSYSWYEKAKEIYPASQIAATAQQRLLPYINTQL